MSVPSFREHLTESKTGKLMHLQHLEDLILDEGIAGFAFAQSVLHEFRHMLKHGGVPRSLNVTTKWDGAPSVVFGPDPADGNFFVATKAAFSKTPKLMKSHQQIHDTYGDSGIANKLHTCFSELHALAPKKILQGDLLFTDDVAQQDIDGKKFMTFRPNTIMYAVDAESDLGFRIRRATIGIVIHTMYNGSGQSIADYHSTPITAGVFASLKHVGRVVAIDSTFDDLSGTVTFTSAENADFDLADHRIAQLGHAVRPNVFASVAMEPLHGLIQMYINAQVRGGLTVAGDRAVTGLMEFIDTRKESEITKRSTPAGQEAIRAKYAAVIDDLRRNFQSYALWFELHAAIANAKNLIVRKLSQASRVGTFVPTADGLKVTSHEGFVAVSHEGKMVKLVDRLEFSRNNFLVPKQWATGA